MSAPLIICQPSLAPAARLRQLRSPLSGRYCSTCGQRADTAAHSVGHFLHELTEALTHADSRVWGTLLPLLRRPGFLTREYFAGRRARYLPPLRLYLFMSVLFLRAERDCSAAAPGTARAVQVRQARRADGLRARCRPT